MVPEEVLEMEAVKDNGDTNGTKGTYRVIK